MGGKDCRVGRDLQGLLSLTPNRDTQNSNPMSSAVQTLFECWQLRAMTWRAYSIPNNPLVKKLPIPPSLTLPSHSSMPFSQVLPLSLERSTPATSLPSWGSCRPSQALPSVSWGSTNKKTLGSPHTSYCRSFTIFVVLKVPYKGDCYIQRCSSVKKCLTENHRAIWYLASS